MLSSLLFRLDGMIIYLRFRKLANSTQISPIVWCLIDEVHCRQQKELRHLNFSYESHRDDHFNSSRALSRLNWIRFNYSVYIRGESLTSPWMGEFMAEECVSLIAEHKLLSPCAAYSIHKIYSMNCWIMLWGVENKFSQTNYRTLDDVFALILESLVELARPRRCSAG